MTRYIDADAILEKVQYRLPIDNKNAEIISGCVDITRRIIEAEPTADAVEVVRCRDCKYRYDDLCPMYYVDEISWDDDGWTETDYVTHDLTNDDGFCDKGERGTEDG